MFYFAIVDDQQLDIDKIKNMIIKYCNNYSITYSIDSYLKDSEQLYEKKYDAIFLDIDLPKINGLNIAKKINSIYKTKIIFITNYKDYMHLTFNVNAFHFVHKEYIGYELYPILSLLFKSIQKKYIIIQDTPIYLVDIIYIQIDDHYCYIYTSKKNIQTWTTLESILDQIDDKKFFRINRQTALNMDYIYAVENNHIILTNNVKLVLSRRRKNEFLKCYHQYLLEQI